MYSNLALITLAALMTGCMTHLAMDVAVDYDPKGDFGALKTYA